MRPGISTVFLALFLGCSAPPEDEEQISPADSRHLPGSWAASDSRELELDPDSTYRECSEKPLCAEGTYRYIRPWIFLSPRSCTEEGRAADCDSLRSEFGSPDWKQAALLSWLPREDTLVAELLLERKCLSGNAWGGCDDVGGPWKYHLRFHPKRRDVSKMGHPFQYVRPYP